MFAEIKIVVKTTDQGNALLTEALNGKDWSNLSDTEKKERQQAEMTAYDKIGEDYEGLLWAIEELVNEFDGTLVTLNMDS